MVVVFNTQAVLSDVSEWTIRKDGERKGSDEATTSATD